MPIDPSIALGLQPSKPIDYLGAYGNALTLKNLMGQQELQGLQLQQARREADKQMRLSDLARASGGDIDKFLTGMAEVDPIGAYELGMKNRKTLAELAKTGMEGRKLALESADKFSPIYLRAAQFVKSRGYTPEAVAEAKQFMLSSGVPSDLVATVPNTVTPEYVDGVIKSNMSFADRLARDKEEFERKYPGEIGKLLYAQEQFRLAQDKEREVEVGNRAKATDDNTVNAPELTLRMLATPFDAPLNRARFGDENAAFLRDERGRVVANQPAQDFLLNKAKSGATKIDVGVQAYEKKLQQNDAEEVSKARASAETAFKNATEVRTIVDVLRGYKGGQWAVLGAKLGEILPGTEFAKASSVYQVAESIRARLAPSLRAVGTGNMTEKETQWFMSSIPNLIMYEEGRNLLAIVFERTAERAAAAADLKDQMIRDGTYSVTGFRKAMQEKFGKGGLLTPEELAYVNRVRQSPPPEPGATAPVPKPDFNLGSMPDPAQNAGREIEATDGTRYKSDGKKWVRQPKGATGRF